MLQQKIKPADAQLPIGGLKLHQNRSLAPFQLGHPPRMIHTNIQRKILDEAGFAVLRNLPSDKLRPSLTQEKNIFLHGLLETFDDILENITDASNVPHGSRWLVEMIAHLVHIPPIHAGLAVAGLLHARIEPQRRVDSQPNHPFNWKIMNDCYPLLFTPVYKDYLWGGTRIPETYNRDIPDGIYAESWEIADHDDGMSVVSNGPMTGKTLREILQSRSREILGSKLKGTRFPLLIKLIDAKKKLSVQVHPNDKTAARFGGDAKTEMWYLLGDNKAQVFCELKDGITKERFIQAVENGTSGSTIQPVPVEKGSAVFVRGGRVHAIDEGCLILEIQQNSNTTYRICDWGRVGPDGKPRELHIQKALDVIEWDDHENPIITPSVRIDTDTFQCTEILKCEYFRLEKLRFSAPIEVPMSGETFHALFVAEGTAVIRWGTKNLSAPAGTSILVPAALPAYTLDGTATVLRTTIP
jgi:mannose-6-phosphate isomerase